MITICFGEELTDYKFEMDFMIDRAASKFEKRSVNIKDALKNCFIQLNKFIETRMENPISLVALSMFGKELDLHHSVPTIRENCRKLRAHIGAYVLDRKAGKNQSQVQNVDMLSLFLESPEIFTQDVIID